MISVIVRKLGPAEEIIGTTITSALITTEPQATKVGLQALAEFYSRKEITLLTPYRGLVDGQVIDFASARPNILGKYWIANTTISIDLETGVSVNLIARKYAWEDD